MKTILFTKPYARVSDISDAMGINQNSLYKWAKDGTIPSKRIGDSIWIDVAHWNVTKPFYEASDQPEPAEPEGQSQKSKESGIKDLILDTLGNHGGLMRSSDLCREVEDAGFSHTKYKVAKQSLKDKGFIIMYKDEETGQFMTGLEAVDKEMLIDEAEESYRASHPNEYKFPVSIPTRVTSKISKLVHGTDISIEQYVTTVLLDHLCRTKE